MTYVIAEPRVHECPVDCIHVGSVRLPGLDGCSAAQAVRPRWATSAWAPRSSPPFPARMGTLGSDHDTDGAQRAVAVLAMRKLWRCACFYNDTQLN